MNGTHKTDRKHTEFIYRKYADFWPFEMNEKKTYNFSSIRQCEMVSVAWVLCVTRKCAMMHIHLQRVGHAL